jgi:glycosyltransferase involved in cell wall biosynthesis
LDFDLKIIFVLNHFLPQQTAGTEVYTWALTKQLQNHGVDVKILIPHYGETKSNDYFFDGIAAHQYSEPSVVDRSLIMCFRVPDGLIHFEKYIHDERPDIIHFHELAGSNGITLKHVQVANQSGAKVLMTFHLAGYSCKTGTLVQQGRTTCDGVIDLQKCSNCYLQSTGNGKIATTLTTASSFLHKFSINTTRWQNKIGTALGTAPIISKLKEDLNSLVSQCDYVISITEWYEKILIANGVDQSKIKVIKQGIPFDPTNYISTRKIHEGPLKLIFLGRINKFKGLHLLVEAIKDIDPLSVQLSIFGNSDDLFYESSLKTQTASNKNISWNGKLNQEDVVKTLYQHDVLCLCSTFSEMSPLVIQEAFAAGIPVIASNVYGNAEQISHNHNGLLFEFNNVNDLREQIIRCLNEPSLLKDLTQNIKPPKSFKEVGREYLDLYKHLLN